MTDRTHLLFRDSAPVTMPGPVTPAASHPELVLSTFTGVGLLDMGFLEAGFHVVSLGDIILGHDIRSRHVQPGVFAGVIGGPPCQDFSKARRTAPTGYGLAMLEQFSRIVTEAQPLWFLCENVAQVPDVIVQGYNVQRLDLDASQFGVEQRRLRHVQFGSRDGTRIVIDRGPVKEMHAFCEPTCLASEGRHGNRRDWTAFCELQGVTDLALPDLTVAARYKVVGNGVPVPMACAVAEAIAGRVHWSKVRLCACGCGRRVTNRQQYATPACRKREQRRRDASPLLQLHAVDPTIL